MTIVIFDPEYFVSVQGTIGIALFKAPNHTWFFDGMDLPLQVDNTQIEYPSINEVLDELYENDELRELAVDHNLIDVQDRDDNDYLNYCRSYD